MLPIASSHPRMCHQRQQELVSGPVTLSCKAFSALGCGSWLTNADTNLSPPARFSTIPSASSATQLCWCHTSPGRSRMASITRRRATWSEIWSSCRRQEKFMLQGMATFCMSSTSLPKRHPSLLPSTLSTSSLVAGPPTWSRM